jgi:hypothetical protein
MQKAFHERNLRHTLYIFLYKVKTIQPLLALKKLEFQTKNLKYETLRVVLLLRFARNDVKGRITARGSQ